MNTDNKKILIAYFSHSGNTREVAKQIQQQLGGDLFEIIPINPYPKEYNAVVAQAKIENKNDFRPQLESYIDNIEDYKIVFVGSPVWWYTVAQPVKTFLAENNLESKTIIPFCTHEGSGQAGSFTDIKALTPHSEVLDGIEIWGSRVRQCQKQISDWLNAIDLLT